MNKYDNIIIGFGKAGKTLAGLLATSGQSVALIERDPEMYGGTCINVACIPTKSLEHSARLSNIQGGSFSAKSDRYKEAVAEKNRLTTMLRQKNYEKVVFSGTVVYDGKAAFVDEHRISISTSEGSVEELYGEQIFINTGSRPFIPPIEGLKDNKFVYTSETLMNRDILPERLAIVGGGYIGLEFASYFTNFGSSVTVIQDGEEFIPREDDDVAASVLESLSGRGIRIMRSTKIERISDEGDHAELILSTGGKTITEKADAVLVATGRRPNIADLNLEAAGVELTDRGAVKTDECLRTNVPHIWAMGDVVGGLQFTYISLDDFRIVKSQLFEDGKRNINNRGAIPYTVFLDPPLSRVGMSETEAIQAGHSIKAVQLPAAAIPKAHVLQKPTGTLKAIVDTDTGLILGAHFFCVESQEMINIIKLCMDAKLPYTVLKDNIFNHPTMSEGLNDLFGMI